MHGFDPALQALSLVSPRQNQRTNKNDNNTNNVKKIHVLRGHSGLVF